MNNICKCGAKPTQIVDNVAYCFSCMLGSLIENAKFSEPIINNK